MSTTFFRYSESRKEWFYYLSFKWIMTYIRSKENHNVFKVEIFTCLYIYMYIYRAFGITVWRRPFFVKLCLAKDFFLLLLLFLPLRSMRKNSWETFQSENSLRTFTSSMGKTFFLNHHKKLFESRERKEERLKSKNVLKKGRKHYSKYVYTHTIIL